MSIRHRFPRIAISAVKLSALLLLMHPAPSHGLDTDPHCKPIEDAAIQATAGRTTPSLTTFPVVVHYMKHATEGGGPDDSVVRGLFPLDQVKAFFDEGGDFNRVWGKKHPKLVFVLVGVQTCPYRKLKGQRDSEIFPNARVEIMEDIGAAFNVETHTLANGPQRFTGLDLYLWAKIEGGFAGFARSAAATPHPSVWLAPDCRQTSPRFCDTKFAHEVGHFLGLCHVCTNADSEMNPTTCRQTCPLEARANRRLESCENPDSDKRAQFKPQLMADQGGTKLEACELSFAVNNAKSILTSGH